MWAFRLAFGLEESMFECCSTRKSARPPTVSPPPVLLSHQHASLDALLDSSPLLTAAADGEVTNFSVTRATAVDIPTARPVVTALAAKEGSLDSKLRHQPSSFASPASPPAPPSLTGGRISPDTPASGSSGIRSPVPRRISWAPPMAGSPQPVREARRASPAQEPATGRKGLTVMQWMHGAPSKKSAASKPATRVQC